MMRTNKKGRYNSIVCIKNEIDGFMKYMGFDERMKELEIFKLWEECVGETIAKYSRPEKIDRNKLLVSVENAVWRFELSQKKREILEKLNEKIKDTHKRIIKDIIFV
jgi:predicted nucleic acid-binding Zn ribbon protein